MAAPTPKTCDVLIVGGAMMGSAVAWFLAKNAQFQGHIVIVERDPGLRQSSTAHSNSCMRQQFSSPLNVKISQFCAEFIAGFARAIGAPDTPAITQRNFGYLYLADSADSARTLRENQRMQAALGAGTQILMPDELAARFPFFNLDGIRLGSLNTVDEGYFDGFTMFEHLRRNAQRAGAQFVHDEVVAVNRQGDRVTGVVLKSGATIGCGVLVNAAGPRCAQVAAMAGLTLPVEPRRRYTFVFDAQTPLDRALPLTVDGSGVHVRSDGQYYMAGATPEPDPAVDPDDFAFDHAIWQDRVWPSIAARIPAFDTLKLINSWVGHYAYNRIDQNAIVGAHDEVSNFLFVNGFSGHGLQQGPAMGRGIAELIIHGEYRTLDLSPFGFGRLAGHGGARETAVI